MAAALERECFSVPWSAESLAAMAADANAYCVAAERDGTLVGYAGMYMLGDECDIANIAVDARYRRSGIGTALLGAMFARAREEGAEAMYLEVRSRNGGAIALYEKFGFERVGERRAYYTKPADDALVMRADVV